MRMKLIFPDERDTTKSTESQPRGSPAQPPTPPPPTTTPPPPQHAYLTTQSEVTAFYGKLITEMSHCRDKYCPNVAETYTNAITTALQMNHPDLHRQVDQCAATHGYDAEACAAINTHATDVAIPIVDAALEEEYLKLPPPALHDYHPLEYLSPFWFEGAGRLWRMWGHGGMTREELERDVVALEAAVDKMEGQARDLLYPHARMARAGLNCTVLKPALLGCLVYAGNMGLMGSCFDKIPMITQCADVERFDPKEDGLYFGAPTSPATPIPSLEVDPLIPRAAV